MQETHPSHTRLAKPFVVLFLLLSLVIGAWLLLQYTPSHDAMKPQFTPVSAPLSQFEPYPVSIREVYETHAGYGLLFPPGSPESNRFGAKVIAPIGENIYLGIGLEATVYDGGLVAVFSASDYSLAPIPITNTHLNRIDEQGILRLYAVPDSNNLVLPGLDPTDSWAYGNVYLIDGDNRVGEKRRQNSGLTYVVHGWDVVSDPKGNLYYSSGSVVPVSFHTEHVSAGEVFMSRDEGRFWERITIDPSQASSSNDFLDATRVYGLAWYQDRLFAITHSNKIFSTKDRGGTWDELQTAEKPVRTFTPIQITYDNAVEEFLLVPNNTNDGLIKITEYDRATAYSTPFTLERSYNGITTDGKWIYVLGYNANMNQSAVYRTQNMIEWYLASTLPPIHSELGGRAYALTYWPAKQELLVTTQGYGAQLFHLAVDSIPSSSPLPSATPSFTPSPTPTPLISSLRCEECDTNRNGILEHSPPTQEDFAFIFSCMGMPYNEPPCNTANLYPDTIIDSTDFVSFINYCRPVYPNNIACADLTPTASPTDIPTPTSTDTPTPTITPTHTPTPLPDLQPPSVSILAPKQGTAVKRGTLIPINAIGEDDAGGSGIASIRIETNGTQICNAVQSPLHCTWRVPSRSGSIIRLTAVATDNAGNTNSHVVTIKSQ